MSETTFEPWTWERIDVEWVRRRMLGNNGDMEKWSGGGCWAKLWDGVKLKHGMVPRHISEKLENFESQKARTMDTTPRPSKNWSPS